MPTTTTKITAHTELAPSAYGSNHRIVLSAPKGTGYRKLAAATFRAAADISEAIADNVAVCFDEYAGQIHLEFAERATEQEIAAGRAVLDSVAVKINGAA